MHWSCCDTDTFSSQELQKAFAALTPSRKEHIQRLRQPEDQRRSLAAELLARQLLQERYGITGAQLHRRENGRPYLEGCDLFISLAHSAQKVACALSASPVGIDVEQIRPVDLKLCRHVCVEQELAYILAEYRQEQDRQCRDPEVLRRFFEVWTAKEAYFKKQGTGITDLRSVNILQQPRQVHLIDGYVLQIL